MKTKITKKEITAIAALSVACLFFLTSCSTVHRFARVLFDRPEDKHYQISEKDIKRFASVVKPSRESLDSVYRQACFHKSRKRYALAIQDYKKILSADPSYLNALNGLAVSYDMIGNYTQAVQCYRRALALSPDSAYLLNNLGYSQYLQGDIGAAIDAFERAIALNAGDSRYHNNLGLAYAGLGDYESAFREFEKAGNDADAHFNMGKILYKKGDYKRAAFHFSKALSIKSPKEYASASKKVADALARVSSGETAVHEKRLAVPEKEEQISSDIKTSAVSNQTGGGEENVATVHVRASGRNNSLRDLPDNRADGKEVTEKKSVLDQRHLPSEVQIEISNGNGVNHMAKTIGEHLKKNDYTRIRLTNADNFNYRNTILYYQKGYMRTAYHVAQQIPGWQEMKEVASLSRPEIKIRVLIGKDIAPYKEVFNRGQSNIFRRAGKPAPSKAIRGYVSTDTFG